MWKDPMHMQIVEMAYLNNLFGYYVETFENT